MVRHGPIAGPFLHFQLWMMVGGDGEGRAGLDLIAIGDGCEAVVFERERAEWGSEFSDALQFRFLSFRTIAFGAATFRKDMQFCAAR